MISRALSSFVRSSFLIAAVRKAVSAGVVSMAAPEETGKTARAVVMLILQNLFNPRFGADFLFVRGARWAVRVCVVCKV